ncbi:ABC transporter substrate-binding protein [Streptococcus saliviloxodontae]|uniref:Iron complex transport system substrate-binding protein n=1 Tax=Streptococcus saliviloxodontae TaxID=1349416 RepID=A0ABS2PJR1_9STRE|nr:ABC transporter substrate-binding protein [Streptococcus saliviloxodontae]MBM7635670.1 iron complex transport system substrate-binding protein [Streptococcus saliviloxodontae]
MKKSHFIYICLVLLVLIGALFVFARRSQETKTTQTSTASSHFTSKTITHDFGTTKLDKEPKKIVILNNLYGEILLPLGITPVGATTAQVGSQEFSTLFKKTFKKAEVVSVGWQKTPDLEKIAELEPDVILMTVHQQDLYDKLNQIAPTIGYQINTESNWDFRDTALKVADIFDKKDQMQKAIDELDQKQAKFAQKVKATYGNQRLMYVRVTEKDIRYYGYGRFGFLYETYGFNRAESFNPSDMYQLIDSEKLLQLNPDLLIVQADSEDLLKTKLKESSVWGQLKAVQNKKVIYADYSTYMLGFGLMSQDAIMSQIEKEWLD